MNFPLKSIRRSVVISLTVLSFVQIISADRARADITVVDGYFQNPPVGQAAGGSIQCPQTTPAIGWTFECPAGGSSGVQLNSISEAPNALPPAQVAYIQNQGIISQTVNLPADGTYTVSFYVAAQAASNPVNTIEPLQVDVSSHTKPSSYNVAQGTFTPASTSSFSLFKLSLTVTDQMQVDLRFTNARSVACTSCTNLIYGVSITESAPTITQSPNDIDPTSTISVKGHDFGSSPGKIELSFLPQSAVKFTGGSKTELTLNVDKNDWDGAATPNSAKSQQIDVASPLGAVADQKVMISLRTADGRVSSAVQAIFHNNAVITNGPDTITPKGAFNLSGWDFGEEAGTVEIHFTNNTFASASLNSHADVEAKDPQWRQWVINATVPDVSGVVEQDVDISFTAKDGRKSNVWKAKFKPRIETKVLSWEHVAVQTCSDQGDVNSCNSSSTSEVPGASCPTPWGFVFPMSDSIVVQHIGCWGLNSDNGIDTLFASVTNGWTITSVTGGFSGTMLENASITANTDIATALPGTSVKVNLPWHIGAEGGELEATYDIMIKGPAGVRTY